VIDPSRAGAIESSPPGASWSSSISVQHSRCNWIRERGLINLPIDLPVVSLSWREAEGGFPFIDELGVLTGISRAGCRTGTNGLLQPCLADTHDRMMSV
jgi:uncharacterized protein (DUF3820 family)